MRSKINSSNIEFKIILRFVYNFVKFVYQVIEINTLKAD